MVSEISKTANIWDSWRWHTLQIRLDYITRMKTLFNRKRFADGEQYFFQKSFQDYCPLQSVEDCLAMSDTEYYVLNALLYGWSSEWNSASDIVTVIETYRHISPNRIRTQPAIVIAISKIPYLLTNYNDSWLTLCKCYVKHYIFVSHRNHNYFGHYRLHYRSLQLVIHFDTNNLDCPYLTSVNHQPLTLWTLYINNQTNDQQNC